MLGFCVDSDSESESEFLVVNQKLESGQQRANFPEKGTSECLSRATNTCWHHTFMCAKLIVKTVIFSFLGLIKICYLLMWPCFLSLVFILHIGESWAEDKGICSASEICLELRWISDLKLLTFIPSGNQSALTSDVNESCNCFIHLIVSCYLFNCDFLIIALISQSRNNRSNIQFKEDCIKKK